MILIALALALDAFGVAVSIGISKKASLVDEFMLTISFGFFQFLFSYIGAYFGIVFNKVVIVMPNIVSGIVVTFIGILMIIDGIKKEKKLIIINKCMYIIIGISVSIDALAVGFTMLNASFKLALDTIFIGVVSIILSALGFILSNYLYKINFVKKYSAFFSGAILIFLGVKMMFKI